MESMGGSTGTTSRAELEQAMERRSARTRWLGPLLIVAAVLIVGGVIAGVFYGVKSESNALNSGIGDPGGRILHTLTSSVSQGVPTGSSVVQRTGRDT